MRKMSSPSPTTCAEAIRDAEADLIRVAYQWAVLHDPARLDPAESTLPGREKARRLGGEGTPQVCEFAAAELGARIGRTTYAAAQLMADALDLQHRHRQLWAGSRPVRSGRPYARASSPARPATCPKTRPAFVDAAVAESADGRIPWSRFEALVEAKVAQAAPEAARQREERASKATFAKKLRTDALGMGYVHGPRRPRHHRPDRRPVGAVADTLVDEIAEERGPTTGPGCAAAGDSRRGPADLCR